MRKESKRESQSSLFFQKNIATQQRRAPSAIVRDWPVATARARKRSLVDGSLEGSAPRVRMDTTLSGTTLTPNSNELRAIEREYCASARKCRGAALI